MPISGDLARRGLVGRTGLAVDRDRAGDAAQHAEEGEQQLALALAVEPAEPDDLALADGERDVVQPLLPARDARRASSGRRRRGRAAAWAGRRCGIRGRSSARRSRRRSARPSGRSRCGGRCGTPSRRRRARRSRACGARCRGSRGPRGAAGAGSRRPCATSAAVSAEVASSRMRSFGLRPSALAISTICRRDSVQVLHQLHRMNVGAADPREQLGGAAALRARCRSGRSGAADR